jgi:GLPGLI family protein
MNKLLLTAAIVTTTVFANAQEKGRVVYQEKVKLEIMLDSSHAEMMADLPKERTTQKELLFTTESSLYQNDKNNKSQDVDRESEDGGRVVIKIDQPDDKVYCDLKNNKIIEKRDFMTRLFLIESDMTKMNWKLTGNQKTILGYPCQEAVLQDTTKKVIVWFTAAIPVATGPNGYSNLPGLILAADINNGKVLITASSVDLKDFDMALLVKPKDGKKVTKEEFNKIVADKRKEMQEENGGNGNVIIKIRN